MKLFNFILVLFNFLFGWWLDRHSRRATERRRLEKYRREVGKFINCPSAVRPLQPEPCSWWKSPQVSMREERERLDKLVYGYWASCLVDEQDVKKRTAEEEAEKRRSIVRLFELVYCHDLFADFEANQAFLCYNQWEDERVDDVDDDCESGYDTDYDQEIDGDTDVDDNDDDGLFYH